MDDDELNGEDQRLVWGHESFTSLGRGHKGFGRGGRMSPLPQHEERQEGVFNYKTESLEFYEKIDVDSYF